ncbi:MAG TPA: winged helix-turn-helix domain-containing protein [Pyrinomonadaceae bacterium]|nr:winged helix-turn-helix domain-containing protein [Pyrinomonadaceae bacterium]
MTTFTGEYYAFDDYHLNISGNEIKLYSGRHQKQLRPDEARVLQKLFENRKSLVNKATLLELLGTNEKDEQVLRKIVLELRKALNDPREEGRIIKTERGQGYRFVADAWPESYEAFRASIDPPTPLPTPPPVIEVQPLTDSNNGMKTFGEWTRGSGMFVSVIAFLCVIAVFVISAKGYRGGWEGLNAVASGAQLVLLFIALLYPLGGARTFKPAGSTLTEDIKTSTGYDDPDEWCEASRIAESVLKRYKGYWWGVLLVWFFLYVSLTLTGLPGLGLNCPIDGSRFCAGGMQKPADLAVSLQGQSKVSIYLSRKLPDGVWQELNDYRGSQPPSVELERAIVDVLNKTLTDRALVNIDSDHFGKLPLSKEMSENLEKRHNLLDQELVSLNRALLLKTYRESAQDVSKRNYSIGLRILTTLFNNVSTLLIFLCFNILNEPTKLKSGTGRVSNAYLYAGVALVSLVSFAEGLLVIYSSSESRYEVLQAWSYGSGFFAGVTMALYFGRLQSVFLGAPRWLVVLLFVYTLIQSLFFFLEERQELAVVLIDFALLMKCLLFLYMVWLFESGRLLFYIVRVRRTHKRVIDEFRIFRRVLDEKN